MATAHIHKTTVIVKDLDDYKRKNLDPEMMEFSMSFYSNTKVKPELPRKPEQPPKKPHESPELDLHKTPKTPKNELLVTNHSNTSILKLASERHLEKNEFRIRKRANSKGNATLKINNSSHHSSPLMNGSLSPTNRNFFSPQIKVHKVKRIAGGSPKLISLDRKQVSGENQDQGSIAKEKNEFLKPFCPNKRGLAEEDSACQKKAFKNISVVKLNIPDFSIKTKFPIQRPSSPRAERIKNLIKVDSPKIKSVKKSLNHLVKPVD